MRALLAYMSPGRKKARVEQHELSDNEGNEADDGEAMDDDVTITKSYGDNDEEPPEGQKSKDKC